MRLLLTTCSLSTWTISTKYKNENEGQYRIQSKCTLPEKQERGQSKN